MAWPLSPLTAYVAGGAPAIKAADLNSFQSAVNSILLGTYSIKSVTIDGTGGSVIAPTSGTLAISTNIGSTVIPTTAVPFGTMYRNHILFGEARVEDSGAVHSGFNVKAAPGPVLGAGHPSVGVYIVTFHATPTNITRTSAQATTRFNVLPRSIAVDTITLAGADLEVKVRVWDEANAPVDEFFDLWVMGG